VSVKKNYNLSLLVVFAVNILCNISASIYIICYIFSFPTKHAPRGCYHLSNVEALQSALFQPSCLEK
jgi:hypothetical protein